MVVQRWSESQSLRVSVLPSLLVMHFAGQQNTARMPLSIIASPRFPPSPPPTAHPLPVICTPTRPAFAIGSPTTPVQAINRLSSFPPSHLLQGARQATLGNHLFNPRSVKCTVCELSHLAATALNHHYTTAPSTSTAPPSVVCAVLASISLLLPFPLSPPVPKSCLSSYLTQHRRRILYLQSSAKRRELHHFTLQ